jgi:hypothetical protein
MPLVRLLFGKFIASGRLMGLAGRLFFTDSAVFLPRPFFLPTTGVFG